MGYYDCDCKGFMKQYTMLRLDLSVSGKILCKCGRPLAQHTYAHPHFVPLFGSPACSRFRLADGYAVDELDITNDDTPVFVEADGVW